MKPPLTRPAADLSRRERNLFRKFLAPLWGERVVRGHSDFCSSLFRVGPRPAPRSATAAFYVDGEPFYVVGVGYYGLRPHQRPGVSYVDYQTGAGPRWILSASRRPISTRCGPGMRSRRGAGAGPEKWAAGAARHLARSASRLL